MTVVFMRNNVFVWQKLITLIIIKATNEFSCNVGIEQRGQNNLEGHYNILKVRPFSDVSDGLAWFCTIVWSSADPPIKTFYHAVASDVNKFPNIRETTHAIFLIFLGSDQMIQL